MTGRGQAPAFNHRVTLNEISAVAVGRCTRAEPERDWMGWEAREGCSGTPSGAIATAQAVLWSWEGSVMKHRPKSIIITIARARIEPKCSAAAAPDAYKHPFDIQLHVRNTAGGGGT